MAVKRIVPEEQISLSPSSVVTDVGAVEGVSTITLKLQEELPHELVAVQMTCVVPMANVDPDAGVQFTVGDGVPLAEGVE